MLEELFCAHRAELTAYCRGLCRSDAAAQDMVQEVFLRATCLWMPCAVPRGKTPPCRS